MWLTNVIFEKRAYHLTYEGFALDMFMNVGFEFVYRVLFGVGGGAVAAKSFQHNV